MQKDIERDALEILSLDLRYCSARKEDMIMRKSVLLARFA